MGVWRKHERCGRTDWGPGFGVSVGGLAIRLKAGPQYTEHGLLMGSRRQGSQTQFWRFCAG